MNEKNNRKNRAVTEAKQAEKETASTIAVGRSSRGTNVAGTFIKSVLTLLALLLLIGLSVVVTWIVAKNPAQKDATVFVEQVKEIATLATAEAHLKVVLEEEDYKLFGAELPFELIGTKRELLFIVPGTVIAGVDLQGITSEDLKVNEETMELEINLPRATFVQEPAIQMDQVITYVDSGLFRGDVNWEEGFELAAEAQDRMKKEAQDIGLLQTAEQSAEKVLKGFFGNLGYTVNVTFE